MHDGIDSRPCDVGVVLAIPFWIKCAARRNGECQKMLAQPPTKYTPPQPFNPSNWIEWHVAKRLENQPPSRLTTCFVLPRIGERSISSSAHLSPTSIFKPRQIRHLLCRQRCCQLWMSLIAPFQ